MREWLALPAWNTPPTPLEAWSERLAAQVHREEGETWLVAAPLRLRGYVVIEDGHPAAINFELEDPEHEEAVARLEQAAAGLGWELHQDDESDEDDNDD